MPTNPTPTERDVRAALSRWWRSLPDWKRLFLFIAFEVMTVVALTHLTSGLL